MAESNIPGDPLAGKSLGERIKALVEDARHYRRDFDVAMQEELDFALKLRHYEDETGETRDRRRVKPKGRELAGKLRHKVAKICEHLFFTVRNVDEQQDVLTAKEVELILKGELNDPIKDYHQRREDMVMAGISARLGVIALDVVPGIGAFDCEVLPRTVNPVGRFYWTPGWKSPHDPTCPWVAEIKTMRLEDIRRMKQDGWKNTEAVMPDGGYARIGRGGDATQAPGNTRLPNNSAIPGSGDTSAEPRATVIHFYERICADTELRPRKDTLRELRPEDFFLRCESCGYENRDHNGRDLPRKKSLPCPQCIATAEQSGMTVDPDLLPKLDLVRHEMDTEEVLSFPKGREVIVACFTPGCPVLSELPWRKIRTVPYIVFGGYEHPYEPIGMSDTAYDWSLQLIADALLRQAYEQMSENKDLIIAPEDGLVDAAGEPWQFADSQGRVAYWTGQGPPQVQHFQGTGIPSGWREIFGQVQNVLMRDMGTSDIAMGPEQSRDIAVGTIKALQSTGEVPVDHHIRRLHRAESIGFSVWVDLISATWTMKRLQRMYPQEGPAIFKMLRGLDMPGVDVVVEAEPRIKDVDQQEVEALIKVLSSPPPMMKVLAKKYGLSPADITEYLAGMEAFQKQNAPKPEPPKPDALLAAMASVAKALPGYMTFEQFQQTLAMAGIKPATEPDEHGILLMQKHLDEGHANLASVTPDGLPDKPRGKFQGGRK